jgi:hypothetical protein
MASMTWGATFEDSCAIATCWRGLFLEYTFCGLEMPIGKLYLWSLYQCICNSKYFYTSTHMYKRISDYLVKRWATSTEELYIKLRHEWWWRRNVLIGTVCFYFFNMVTRIFKMINYDSYWNWKVQPTLEWPLKNNKEKTKFKVNRENKIQ